MTDAPAPMKKVQLERLLQTLEPVPHPRADIEQYATPAGIAAEVAYIAHGKGDIAGRRVLDAGCGNGVLGIAAKLLGAVAVVGVDVDPSAVQVAQRNAARARVDVDWREGDVVAVGGRFDTVIMNPPFGSQRRHADLPFLDRGMAIGRIVYSFHNAVTEAFLRRHIKDHGGRITDCLEYVFPLAHSFEFHREEMRPVAVLLLRIEPRV